VASGEEGGARRPPCALDQPGAHEAAGVVNGNYSWTEWGRRRPVPGLGSSWSTAACARS